MKYDRQNVDVYLGLDQAMEKAGQSGTERAQALESFPDMPSAPAALVFRLVEVLSEAQEFDQAEKLVEHRFFPREEGARLWPRHMSPCDSSTRRPELLNTIVLENWR